MRGKGICKIISYILGTLICIFFLFGILLLIDFKHEEIRHIVGRCFGKTNYFEGEIWFTVIATCFAAVPGMICGFIAIIQTKRIHDLENRYHRPSLRLRNALMEVYWLRTSYYNEYVWGDRKKRHIAKKILKDEEYEGNLLAFSLELESKNDVEIDMIEIEDILFRINGMEYRLVLKKLESDIFVSNNCEFSRRFKDEKYLYCIECVVYPFEFSAESGEEKFWDGIEMFTNYQGQLDDEYENIEITFNFKVYYEYAPKGFENVMGKIFWNCHQAGRYGVRAEGRSENGYFRYYG